MSQDLHIASQEPPERVGPYRIGERLGAGGMGEVYRAYDERLERWVAIKQIRPGKAESHKARQRFRREARAAAGLAHPAIVQVFDILETEHGDWIVSELVEGESLHRLLRSGRLDLAQILALAAEIAEGLVEAHGKGIVHRDLKTENVMVTQTGHPKILDFGIAKRLWADHDETLSDDIIVGTSRAMSPEQAQGDEVDHRSDLFSLGTLLYEMLTGESPFLSSSSLQTLTRICSHRQPSVQEVRPEVPGDLSSLVDRLLEKDPSYRPQSTAEVAMTLGSLADSMTGERRLPKITLPAREGMDDEATRPMTYGTATGPTRGIAVKTLLVIDLVDSTKLVERLGDARAYDVLARHDRLARDLVARFGGREIDKTDGFLLLFERPIDAVGCTLEYHEELSQLSAEVGIEIQARAGIHLGEVFLRENTPEDVTRGAKPLEVEGLAKPIAARTMSIAQGGQTLLTRGAFELSQRAMAGQETGRKLRWMVHGSYLFKGIEKPAEVFEVGVEGLAPFAAPADTDKAHWVADGEGRETRWSRSRKHRRRLIFAAAAALLVLAIAAVYIFRGGLSFPSGSARPTVAVLGFQNIGKPEEAWLSTALAEMISTELAAGENLRMIPGESIARMKKELSLPTLESLADDTLKEIRRNLGNDYVVLGSYLAHEQEVGRQLVLLLRLQDTRSGETIVDKSITGVDARLFDLVARAGAELRPDLGVGEISGLQAEAVRATLSSSPEATRLYSEGLAKLRSYDAVGARDVLLRTVEIDPEYAVAHAALSEAWLALGYDGKARQSASRALELGKGLPREKYLDIEGHYYETAGERQAVVETYQLLWDYHPGNVDHGLKLAEAQTIAGHGLAALETVAALCALPAPACHDPRIDLAEAEAAGSLSDFTRQLDAAERAVERGQARQAWLLVAQAQWHRAHALRRLGRPDLATEALEEARRLYSAAGDLGNAAATLNTAANIRLNAKGELSSAKQLYREALAIQEEIGNRRWVSTIKFNLAVLAGAHGDLSAAQRLVEETLAMVREIDDPSREAKRLEFIGWIRLDLGDLAGAEQMAREALAICNTIGRQRGVALTSFLIGRIHFAAGSVTLAEPAYRKALAISDQIGEQQVSARVLNGLGELLLAKGELAAATQAFEDCAAIRSKLGGKGFLPETVLARAALRITLERPAEAEKLAREKLAEYRREYRRDAELSASAVLARALLAQGKLDEARATLAVARELTEITESPRARLSAAIVAARLRAAEQSYDAARRALEAVVREATDLGLLALQLEARLALGEVELAAGELTAGRSRLEALAEEARSRG
ncbi:MAG: protein kinase, partial [bacterium]|nr:protein kinase [bacterium]